MSKIVEQMQKKCVHFNGIMNDFCKAGVEYKTVRVPNVRPFQFPCISTGGSCEKCQFPTADQVKKDLEEMETLSQNALNALFKIKINISQTGKANGSIPCVCCEGNINYQKANNGHIWAKCDVCGISCIE